MTALYAASRDALVDEVDTQLADYLLDTGKAQILDPNNDALVERLARRAHEIARDEYQEIGEANFVRAVLRALVEDRP